MSAPASSGPAAKYHPVIVRQEGQEQFSAQPLGVPEIRAIAATADEALAEARDALAQWPGVLHWVQLPAPPASVPAAAGHAKDDPDIQAYLEEIQRYRQEVEARECSSSSSTPTT